MDALGVVGIGIGLLVIVVRAPLIVAPRATVNVYRRLVNNRGSVRGLGAVLLALGVLTRLSGTTAPDSGAAQGVLAIGILLAIAGAFLLALPGPYMRLAEGALRFADREIDGLGMRLLGLVGVVIGAGIVWLGASVQ